MGSINVLTCTVVLVLWVFGFVLCEHQKRDVHRIIIKETVPRSSKKGHQHSHTHGHSHKSQGHTIKKGKNPHKHHDPDSGSYESSEHYSRENSYEEVFHSRKPQKFHYKKKTTHKRPSYPANLEIGESRHNQYKEELHPFFNSEWVPLSNDQVHHSQEYRENLRRKKRKDHKNKNRKQTSKNKNPFHDVEHLPINFDTSTLYPAFSDVFSDYNKKIIESNQSPFVAAFNLEDESDRIRNHRLSYDAKEADDIGSFILVPDGKPHSDLDVNRRKLGVTELPKNGKPITYSGKKKY